MTSAQPGQKAKAAKAGAKAKAKAAGGKQEGSKASKQSVDSVSTSIDAAVALLRRVRKIDALADFKDFEKEMKETEAKLRNKDELVMSEIEDKLEGFRLAVAGLDCTRALLAKWKAASHTASEKTEWLSSWPSASSRRSLVMVVAVVVPMHRRFASPQPRTWSRWLCSRHAIRTSLQRLPGVSACLSWTTLMLCEGRLNVFRDR